MHKTSRRLISLSHTYTQIQTHVFFQILHLFTDKVWKYRENYFRGRLSRSFESVFVQAHILYLGLSDELQLTHISLHTSLK